ncbi:hypothetical protein ATR1_453d0065 [Acetobacter tropicalis]|nr:hypothetical protein ATR1_453d0065 [Acetobacter tropicalis]
MHCVGVFMRLMLNFYGTKRGVRHWVFKEYTAPDYTEAYFFVWFSAGGKETNQPIKRAALRQSEPCLHHP